MQAEIVAIPIYYHPRPPSAPAPADPSPTRVPPAARPLPPRPAPPPVRQLHTATPPRPHLSSTRACRTPAPSQPREEAVKKIPGTAQAVVNGLAALRNEQGDAHGKGQKAYRPAARHAELAVGFAGTIASFLVSTWQQRKN